MVIAQSLPPSSARPHPRAGADEDQPRRRGDLPTVEQIEQAVVAVHREGHEQAVGIMSAWHRRWDRYRRLYAGEWTLDDDRQTPITNEIYIPKLAELIEYSAQATIQQLIPDAQTMDWVSVVAEWVGMEEDADRSQALFRQKLRQMQPRDASGLYDCIYNLEIDRRTLGNAVAVIGHEVDAGDGDEDELLEGPTIERVDPRNWFPWSVNVDHARMTSHTIYAPLMDADADEIPYIDAERLRQIKPKQLSRVHKQGDWLQGLDWDGFWGPDDTGWERIVYYGPLRWRAIALALERPDWTREDVVAALGGKNADKKPVARFDLAHGSRHWWTVEWVDDRLLTIRPYPLDLPRGRCPVWHATFFKISSSLVGRGGYDRLEWLERLWNMYNRYHARITEFEADRPFLYWAKMIDQEWLAERDGIVSLEPGDGISLNDELLLSNPAAIRDPIKPLDMGNGAILNLLDERMDRLEKIMRDNLQTTEAYTGQASARTATEAQNNLTQSRGPEQHQVKMAENGWLEDLTIRLYVVMRQVIRLRAELGMDPQFARAGADEQHLMMFAIEPSAVRSLSYYDVQIGGSSSPQNKLFLLEQWKWILTTLVPQGLPIKPVLKLILRAMDVRGANKIFEMWQEPELGQAIQHVQTLIGPRGVAALPPAAQAALAQLVAGAQAGGMAQPMPGAPMGGNGRGMPMGTDQGMTGRMPARPPGAPQAPGMTGVM